MKNRTEELREASGMVTYTDPLTSFFYQLIRDEMPLGKVEQMVRNVIDEGGQECLYTNGWLAQYAHNLAEMIRNAQTIKLSEALTKVFDEEEISKQNSEKISSAINKLRINGGMEEFTPEELGELEKRVVVACEKADVDISKDAPVEAWTSFDEAAEMIEHLKAEGQITDEDAKRLNVELQECQETLKIEGVVESEQDLPELQLEEIIEEEPKLSCCGKCKQQVGACDSNEKSKIEMSSNGESFTSGTITVTDSKWDTTKKYLDDLDKELETLTPAPVKTNKETMVVFGVEPRIIGADECKEIQNMLDGMGPILNTEIKKEE